MILFLEKMFIYLERESRGGAERERERKRERREGTPSRLRAASLYVGLKPTNPEIMT